MRAAAAAESITCSMRLPGRQACSPRTMVSTSGNSGISSEDNSKYHPPITRITGIQNKRKMNTDEHR
jgi:hypothetical protein